MADTGNPPQSSREKLRKLFEAALKPQTEEEAEQIDLEIDALVLDIEAEALQKEGFEEFALDYLADKQRVISDALVMKSQGLNREEG